MKKESSQQKEIDRLSTLPNDILVEILGFLPINTAATTTVLSRRWHSLWTQVTSIRINREFFAVTKNQEFPNYSVVLKILEKLTSPVIKTCDIYFPKLSPDIIDAAKDAPISRIQVQFRQTIALHKHVNAHNLSMLVRHTLDRGGKNIRLVLANGCSPNVLLSVTMNVYDLKSLVELELDDQCNCPWVLKDGQNVSLPFMRKLTVPMRDSQVNVLPVIIKSCPLLEYLTINGRLSRGHNNAIEISAQKLKSLVLQMRYTYTRKQVVIDAPLLQNLYIWDINYLSTYSFVNRPTALVTANVFRNYVWEGEQPPHQKLKEQELIGAICSASVLTLISPAFQDMNQQVKLPAFGHVTSLGVGIKFQKQWQRLMHFITFLPNLQQLDIISFDETTEVQTSNPIGFNHHEVPTCLSTKVEIIHLSRLQAVPQELEIIGYLLRVANVLKTLDITVASNVYFPQREIQACKESDFCAQLYKFPKSSSACQVSFTGIFVNVSTERVKLRALGSGLSRFRF